MSTVRFFLLSMTMEATQPNDLHCPRTEAQGHQIPQPQREKELVHVLPAQLYFRLRGAADDLHL